VYLTVSFSGSFCAGGLSLLGQSKSEQLINAAAVISKTNKHKVNLIFFIKTPFLYLVTLILAEKALQMRYKSKSCLKPKFTFGFSGKKRKRGAKSASLSERNIAQNYAKLGRTTN
jgi:hypothetical protein